MDRKVVITTAAFLVVAVAGGVTSGLVFTGSSSKSAIPQATLPGYTTVKDPTFDPPKGLKQCYDYTASWDAMENAHGYRLYLDGVYKTSTNGATVVKHISICGDGHIISVTTLYGDGSESTPSDLKIVLPVSGAK